MIGQQHSLDTDFENQQEGPVARQQHSLDTDLQNPQEGPVAGPASTYHRTATESTFVTMQLMAILEIILTPHSNTDLTRGNVYPGTPCTCPCNKVTSGLSVNYSNTGLTRGVSPTLKSHPP